MPFQRVPNSAQIEFRYLTNGVPIVNTVYAQYPLGYDAAALDDLADAAQAWGEVGVITNMASDTVFTGVTVRGLDTEFDLVASRTDATPTAGGVAGFSCPLNVAFCIQFNAGLTGRSTRNRNYIGGIPESSVGTRSMNTAQADAMVAEYLTLKAAIFAAGWTQIVVSRYAGGTKRVTAMTWPVVNILYTDLRIDTRRARLNNA